MDGFRGQSPEEGTGSPRSGVIIQVVMNHPLWVLRMKLKSSARAEKGPHVEVKEQLSEMVPSFHLVESRKQTQVVRLCGKFTC